MNTESKRNRAASIFRILGLIQFILGVLLLILGGVAQSYHGDTDRDGAHYYSSAFLVGSFVIVLSILDIVIYIRGRGCYSRERAIKRMTCLLQIYSVLVALNFVCCITGMVITGLSGICKSDNCVFQQNQTTNFGMAIAILITIGTVFLSCIFGLVILCTHSSYFGITLFKKGQNRISNTSSSPVSMRAIGPFVIPTGQESDETRRHQASLGVSLQTQLQQQHQRDLNNRTRQSRSELPPIRGQRGNQINLFLYEERSHTPDHSTPVTVPDRSTPVNVHRQSTPVKRHRYSSSVNVARHSTPVNIPQPSSSVNVSRHSTPVNIPQPSSPVNVPQHSSPINVPQYSSPVNVSRQSSPINVPRHSSPVNIHQHRTPIFFPEHFTPINVPQDSPPAVVPQQRAPSRPPVEIPQVWWDPPDDSPPDSSLQDDSPPPYTP